MVGLMGNIAQPIGDTMTNEPDPQLNPMWVEHQIGNSKWIVYPNICEQDDNGNWITHWNVEHPRKGCSSLCFALEQGAVEGDDYNSIPNSIMQRIERLATELLCAGVY